jgi:aryl-alcohol dehydrogenase-like predicted oxidoreductase
MRQKPLGRTGLTVSELSLGTMTWGRDTDEYEAREQLDLFFASGGNLIDTADTFSAGAAEEMLGEFLSEIPRHEYLISSKSGRVSGDRGHDSSRVHLLQTIDASLQRLRIEYLDIWHLHGYDNVTQFEIVADTLASLIQSGKVRYIGVSNLAPWQLVMINSLLPIGRTLGSAQYEYSLLQRGIENELLPAVSQFGIGVLAWSPLGRGVLTGKYRNSIPADSRAASPHWGAFARHLLTDQSRNIVEAVTTAAQGLGTSPLDVALSWVRQNPNVTSAITGARTAAQLRTLLATAGTDLPAEIVSALDDVSRKEAIYPAANFFQE